MTREVVTVGPKTRASVAAALMESRRLRVLPVVADGVVVGMLAKTDLQSVRPHPPNAKDEGQSDAEVGTLVRQPVVVVEADAPLEDAVWIMREQRHETLPVVRNGKFIGILSQADVTRALNEMRVTAGARRRGLLVRRVTAEAPEDPQIAEKIAAGCSQLGFDLRSFMRVEHEGKSLLVISVCGDPLEPLIERLWALGCRIRHVSP